jgi:hypothetical protein
MIGIFEKLAPQWRRAVKEYARSVWDNEDDDEAREIYDSRARLFARRYRHALEDHYAAKGMRVYRGTLDGKVKEWLNVQGALRDSMKTMVSDRQNELVRKEIARLQKEDSYTAQEALNKVYEARDGENVYKVFSFNDYYKDKSEQIGDDNAYNLGTEINEGIIQQFSDRYIWTTQRDKRVRQTHRKLSGKCFLFDDPPTTVTKYGKEHKGNPGTEWGCVPSGTLIRLNSDVIRCFRRAYTGELTAIVLESGIMFRATGNHPVLTKRGWQPADNVAVGDYLVKVPDKSLDGIDGNEYNTGVPVEQVFDFFSLCGDKESVPGTRSQFHGDGIPEKEVEIVTVKRELTDEWNVVTGEKVGKLVFTDADMMSGHLLGTSEREFSSALFGLGMATRRNISGASDCLSLFGRGILKANDVGLTTVPRSNSCFDDDALNECAHGGIVEMFSGASNSAQAAHIVADDLIFERVIEVMRVPYIGHVYNLQTATEWYIANGLSIHNCRCYAAIPTKPTKPLRGYVVHER